MTELDSLLQAIPREPGEDLARLVFADWLDDHADAMPDPEGARARAEFIRVQIALEEWGRESKRSVVAKLIGRERELFQSNAIGRFFPEEMGFHLTLTDGPAGDRPTALLRRGFPASVTLPSLADWERWGKEIAAAAPVTEMVVADREPMIRYGRRPHSRVGIPESWAWTIASEVRWHLGNEDSELPGPVFRRLHVIQHATRDSAILAASRAFADEARARANLPPVWTRKRCWCLRCCTSRGKMTRSSLPPPAMPYQPSSTNATASRPRMPGSPK